MGIADLGDEEPDMQDRALLEARSALDDCVDENKRLRERIKELENEVVRLQAQKKKLLEKRSEPRTQP